METSTQFPVVELASNFIYEPISGVVTRIDKPLRKPNGYLNKDGYIQIDLVKRRFLAHRIAWALTHGAWPEQQIDHINGVRTDNRLSNLREAAPRQNSRNMSIPLSAAGFKGVSPKEKRYIARITIDHARHHLGLYDDPRDAALAYDRAAIYFGGEFAATNFSLGLL